MLEYFDKNYPNFELVKNVVNTMKCINTINALNNMNFGFINMNRKHVSGFVLCKKVPHGDVIMITLPPNFNKGKALLKAAENQAVIEGFYKTAVHIICKNRVANWYKKQGYEQLSVIDNKPKVYYMEKEAYII